jgi:CelD/BcsL family acetyltransferase involved in cellulose biosynthesis
VLARPAPGCPQIALDDSWREPERKYSASRRSDLRRRQRIAESFGPVTFETVSPSRQQVGPLLEELLRVEDSSWKGKAGSALLRDEALGGFFRRYAEAASDKGILRFFFMRIGGRAVAGELAAQCAGRFWALKIGYDEEFRRCAPGMLLTLFTLRYAAACGLHSYEFLGSIAPWTLEWTKTEHSCSSLRLYPAGIRGFATLAAETAQWGWRKAAAAVARSTSPQPATSPEQAT